jgi:hypothetical protein
MTEYILIIEEADIQELDDIQSSWENVDKNWPKATYKHAFVPFTQGILLC